MKPTKFAAAALGTTALALLSGSVKADTVVFAGAGSSAQWKIFEQAALSQFPNHYSAHNGGIVHDSANPNHVEKGDIWVAWDNNTPTNVAYFVKVDSTVGVRAYFNNDTGSFTGTTPIAFDNTGYPGTGDQTPPSNVIADVNGSATAFPGSPINIGLTDITPADAQVATARSIALGYNINNPVKSDFDTTSSATPVPFNIGARSFNLVPLGAAPVIVFVNVSDTAAGGFGSIPTDPTANPSYEFRNNIDRFTLAGFLSGQFGRTRQLNSDPTLFNGMGAGNSADPAKSVTTIVREPLSGTYNTMEYCVPESVEGNLFTGGAGQELNFPSSVTHVNGAGGIRRRAIGTGQSVLQGNTIANSLGYAFGAIANFKGDTNLRYLTVDGADPIYDSYSVSEGNLQPLSTALSFRNIKNGGYPIWSVLRAVTQSPTPAAISTIISNLAPSDFVKFTNLEVFRSYHDTPGSISSGSASNGHIFGGGAFNSPIGGDVGGAVFPINADYDFINDAGAELTNLLQ